ncbi:MAG: glycoside hydrolase, partial [Rhodobacteraceae bacterium]|nr:glycoside hydrolase [Paracoccaceae bacterium]
VLRGKKGRDYLEGGNGNDFLSGGNARDWLVGGRGGDRLQGGKQDDILTGDQGRDTFVFRADHGRDIVTDFAVGKDTLELKGAEFSDLTIKKAFKGTGARVEWDEGTILLEGVQRDSLTEDDFAFIA